MHTIEHTDAVPKEPQKLQYFHFSQNNPGGSFDIDDTIAHHVIIQAHYAEEANNIARDIGIYFNGCETGADCSCCGDRWYEAYGQGTETPLIYDSNPATHEDYFTKPGQPMCHVYHFNGSKTTYRKKNKG